MRWFKHMAASWDDEKLAGLVDQHGLEGYGFWWRVVEVVAAKVDKSEQTSAEFPAKKWGTLLGLSPKKFRMLAECCANLGLFSLELSQNAIRIDMPNILKFRDEYTEKEARKSGVGRDKLRPSRARVPETDTETETEEDKEENTASATPSAEPTSPVSQEEARQEPAATGTPQAVDASPPPPAPAKAKGKQPAPPPGEPHYRAKSGRCLTGKRLNAFEQHFWPAFALPKGKAEAADAWLDIPQLTDVLVAHICHAARMEAAERALLEAKGQTPKWAQGWLNARRWEDYPMPQARDRPADGQSAEDVPAYEKPELTPEEQAAAKAKREQLMRARRGGSGAQAGAA